MNNLFHRIRRRATLSLSLALAAACCALPLGSAQAQGKFPNHAIQVIVCYAPGGTGDVFARVVSEKLGTALGQSIVVENRPGAGGMIGTQMVAKAAPDGYTLLLGQTGEIAINKALMKTKVVDPEKDLATVALVGKVPLALVVRGDAPYANARALTDAMQANAPGLSFASAGIGTPGHLAGEQLKLATHSSIVHVPYKGASVALADLLGGHVTYFFSGMPAAVPHIKSGRLRLLAVSTANRTPSSPDTPTVAESGQPGFDFALWGGFFAPAGTPRDIVQLLNREINKVLAIPEVRDRLAAEGTDIVASNPEQFAAFVQTEMRKYEKIIRDTGVKGE